MVRMQVFIFVLAIVIGIVLWRRLGGPS